MDSIRLKARAKINIGLDIVSKREDGYHNMRMVMQTLSMFDKLNLKKLSGSNIEMKTNLSYVPANENNLCYKAAKLLLDEFNIKDGVYIELEKYIPVSAGMAGGSSDAAAVMVGVNKLYDLGLSVEELMKRGVKIGADVPYCLLRGTALAEGIGDELTRLSPFPECYVVVAKPSASVSTKSVFSKFRLDDVKQHPDIDGMIEAINAADLHQVAGKMGNVLETVTIGELPVINDIKAIMLDKGALNSLMSGSGPSVFGLYEDIKSAKDAFYELKRSRKAKQVFLTEIFNV